MIFSLGAYQSKQRVLGSRSRMGGLRTQCVAVSIGDTYWFHLSRVCERLVRKNWDSGR